jgi:predicted metal-dependent enzyme (double-stranded beta helix superfamily)
MHPTGALHVFILGVDEALRAGGHQEPIFLPQIAELMRRLIARDDWLAPAFAQPHPHYYQQHLLYADPAERFSVVSFVWGPGQSTPIHDHTVWGVIGMLRGVELAERFVVEPGRPPLPVGGVERLEPGSVSCVSPLLGDVHRVRNAFDDRVSISIHAYGGNIGTIQRHVFTPQGECKGFVSGYSSS